MNIRKNINVKKKQQQQTTADNMYIHDNDFQVI